MLYDMKLKKIILFKKKFCFVFISIDFFGLNENF